MSKTKPALSELTEVPGWNGKFLLGPNHTYWWKDGDNLKALSGTTSVLNVIAKPALIQWAANMAVDHIVAGWKVTIGQDLDLLKAREQEFIDLCVEARTAHNKKKEVAAEAGHDAHALVEEYIKACINHNDGIPYALSSMNIMSREPRVMEFAQWAMERHLEKKFRFLASEVPLADVKLAIAGTPDFIAEELKMRADGQLEMMPMIGDLKTGSGVYDRVFFAQMACYGYMWMKRNKSRIAPSLLVVHAPSKKPNQAIATYYSDDFKGDWEAFQAALTLHRWKDNFVKPKWNK